MSGAGPRIELVRATRRFGSLVAVSSFDATLEPGTIHAIIGENGAGKSTALKLIAGLLSPSDGRVLIDGEELVPATAQEAFRRGVGMVHQHFMLVERMTALDNLLLGAEITTGPLGRLDRSAARERAQRIASETSLEVALDQPVHALSVGERQRLEILRVLFRGARGVLLDEPTQVLSPVEVSELYATLRSLAEQGRTIAVVTHRLDEVIRFCDRVSVMRRGEGVLDRALTRGQDITEELTRAIMGGEIAEAAVRPEIAAGDPLLVVDDNVSIRPGEIIGVAGIEGNGQRELVTRLALDPGVVAVHEDRHREELLLDASVADNLVLGDLDKLEDEAKAVAERFKRFDIYPPRPTPTRRRTQRRQPAEGCHGAGARSETKAPRSGATYARRGRRHRAHHPTRHRGAGPTRRGRPAHQRRSPRAQIAVPSDRRHPQRKIRGHVLTRCIR